MEIVYLRETQEDYELVSVMGESILFLRQAFEEKRISERRLLRMLFGPTAESSKSILENKTPMESTQMGVAANNYRILQSSRKCFYY